MGNSISKSLDNPASASLTADSIEQFYDILARKRREREENFRRGHNLFEGNDGDGKDEEEKKEDRKEDPDDNSKAKMDLDAAFQAVQRQDKDAYDRAITSLTKFGLQLNQIAKVAVAWTKAHPYLTAAIVVSLVLFACTPAIIQATGFGVGGIVRENERRQMAAVMGASACIPAAMIGLAALWTRWQDKKKDDENELG
ncbi:hypothetical protein E8E11_001287 [Didymella keratinophila]|nr:hypothetical protein E8E11_001287 [Didymella keratinophila]